MRNMTKIKRVTEFCNFGIMKLFVVLIADFLVSVGGFFYRANKDIADSQVKRLVTSPCLY